MRKSTVAAAVAVVTAGLGYLGIRRVVDRWARNPNPLAGESMEFPSTVSATVTTDDGAKIAIRRSGSGPTILMVHGLTGNRDNWSPIARRLLHEGFEVVAMEQRGHGDSGRGTDGYGARRLAADLAQVLSALNLHDVILAGHSMGGMAAMTMAVEHPEVMTERVRKLVILASSPTLTNPRIQLALRVLAIESLDRFTKFDDRLRFGTGKVAFGENPSLELVDYLIESTGRCPNDVRRHATAGLIGFDVTGGLPSVSADTLVISGTHDRLTPLEYGRMIDEGIPHSRLEIIDGGGHVMMLDHADRIAFLIAEFARLATRPRSEPSQTTSNEVDGTTR